MQDSKQWLLAILSCPLATALIFVVFLVYFPKQESSNLFIYEAESPSLHFSDNYADEVEHRRRVFRAELHLFQSIGKKLLRGNRMAFKMLPRYYVPSEELKEFTLGYIHNEWSNKRSHVNATKYLKGAHPSCITLESKESVLSNRDVNLEKVQKIETYFTHACCNKSGPSHGRSALINGRFDKVVHFTMRNLTLEFQNRNNHILSQRRGAGYWLWKPYVILDLMINKLNPCDIVCYCDTGVTWAKSAGAFWELASKMKYGVLTFNQGAHESQLEKYWTKRDAFVLMDVDKPEMHNTLHKQASFICFQKNPDSVHFLNEWLYWSMNEQILTDLPSKLAPNLPGFRENRHDQTILSVLSKKYGIPGLAEPTQTSRGALRRWGPVVKHWKEDFIVDHTRNKSRL